MGLADALATERRAKFPKRCQTCLAIAALRPDDRDALRVALADERPGHRLTGDQISDLLAEFADLRVPADSINRHRRGVCRGESV